MQEECTPPATAAAEAWAEANIPAGARLALEGKDIFPSQYMPRLRQTRESLTAKIRHIEKTDANKAQLLTRYWLPTRNDSSGFHIELYGYSRDRLTLEWFQERNIQYLIVHDVHAAPDSEYEQRVGIMTETLTSPGIELLSEFGSREGYSGRAVRIYRLPLGP